MMKSNVTLFALAIGTFAIGPTEFTPMGLLLVIARSVHVSIPTAGMPVTAHAVGVMLGAPVMTLPFSHFGRRAVLISLGHTPEPPARIAQRARHAPLPARTEQRPYSPTGRRRHPAHRSQRACDVPTIASGKEPGRWPTTLPRIATAPTNRCVRKPRK